MATIVRLESVSFFSWFFGDPCYLVNGDCYYNFNRLCADHMYVDKILK